MAHEYELYLPMKWLHLNFLLGKSVWLLEPLKGILNELPML